MQRPPLVLLLATLLLAMTVPGASVWADPPKHGVPEVRPVQLDGSPATPEWADALAMPIEPGTALRLQQYRGTVMLSLLSDRIWTEGSVLTLFFCPNGPKAGGQSPGCLRIDYEPFRHNRAHVIAYRYDAASAARRIHGQVVVRHVLGDHGSQLEMAFPSALLGLTTTRIVPIRFCAQWARRGTRALTYPTGLDLRGVAGQTPPDFVSAGRWAVLEGWGDPAGPGAFPAAQWKAWVEHDAEIARRGRAAHSRISEMTEEWDKEKKADTEMHAEVCEQFAWIRQHEPLTTDDVLAMATLWRYLNQHAHAAAMLSTVIDTARDRSTHMRALHQRALVHHAWEKYDEEAADWTRLAELAGTMGGRYKQAAERAVKAKEPWASEQKARRAAEANDKLPRVQFDTVRGPITVVLHADVTPKAVKHFLALVESKYYDGMRFHRVKGDYMAQAGDPKSREFATGGRSPTKVDVEIDTRHDFYRGALCFARPVDEDTNGGQFFFMTSPKPGLGRYTIFGHVVSGMQAVDRLERWDALTRVAVRKK